MGLGLALSSLVYPAVPSAGAAQISEIFAPWMRMLPGTAGLGGGLLLPCGLACVPLLPGTGRPGTACSPSMEQGRGHGDGPFSGLCRNVTAQSHLDLKVWSCHTLRNELLGTASVSLGSLLKSGGKRMYKPDHTGVPRPPPWLGALRSARPPVGVERGGEVVAPAAPMQPPTPGREQGAIVCPGLPVRAGGLGCDRSHTSPSQGAWKHKPLSYLLPFVVARVWLVTAATA